MRLSPRAARISESATLRVARRAMELRAAGVELADLGAGEPDFPSPPAAVEAARQALADGFTKYTPAAGTPELRRTITKRYEREHGAPWAAGDVVVTVGAKAGLFELALALIGAGDEVIIPSPCWVSFPEQVRFTGGEPVLVPMAASRGFRIEAEPIIERLGPATRAVIINSPCNPTGGMIDGEALRAIVEACARNGTVLISDETYDRFSYDGANPSAAALAAEFPETVVVVSSFSKTYAMTGWRLGYVLGPPAIIKAVSTVQSHSTSNATSFAMVGAVAALEEAGGEVEEMIEEYRQRRELVMRWLDQMPGVTCAAPAGSFYAFPDVSGCYTEECPDSIFFAGYLLESARVAVVPGVAFHADDHVRISFACSRQTLDEGLGRMARALPVAAAAS